MRVIIAGSRSITSLPYVMRAVRCSGFEITEVVSGGARGVDTLGEQVAADLCVPMKRFPADWGRYGLKAGPMRNAEMAKYADALIAIPDHGSIGTRDMIRKARARKLKVYVHPLPAPARAAPSSDLLWEWQAAAPPREPVIAVGKGPPIPVAGAPAAPPEREEAWPLRFCTDYFCAGHVSDPRSCEEVRNDAHEDALATFHADPPGEPNQSTLQPPCNDPQAGELEEAPPDEGGGLWFCTDDFCAGHTGDMSQTCQTVAIAAARSSAFREAAEMTRSRASTARDTMAINALKNLEDDLRALAEGSLSPSSTVEGNNNLPANSGETNE